MEARECSECGAWFTPKYEWSKQCWDCWFASPAGRAWKAKKDAEATSEQQKQNFYGGGRGGGKSEQQRRHTEQARPTGGGGTLDATMLRRLLQLCHPDKHGGSELANTVTQELLRMKDRL